MIYPIGTKVTTKRGNGIVRDFKFTAIDGNCYLIELSDGSKIWRTEKSVRPILECFPVTATKIAQAIAKRFNLDVNEVEAVILLSVLEITSMNT